MAAVKSRKPVKRVAKKKVSRKTKTKSKPALKARSRARTKVKVLKKAPVIPPHPDQTGVRLGPHRADHHLEIGGIRVHPAPIHPIASHHAATIRHH